jgi:hypothetical protein
VGDREKSGVRRAHEGRKVEDEQTNVQTERTSQILEDMLRACALKYGKSWDKSVPYTEFSYHNNYQASNEMAPHEAQCG